MLIIQGFSETRSTYCRATNYLRLYGWVLSPIVDEIKVYSKNKEIGSAIVGLPSEKIWESHHKQGSKNSAWQFESKIGFQLNSKNLSIHFYKNKNLLFINKFPMNINKKQEKYLEKYLENFKFINDEKIPLGKKYTNIKKILLEFKKKDIEVKNIDFSYKKYMSWFKKVDYFNNYPSYCEAHGGHDIHTKALQHYLSIELLDLHKDDIYMDIASSSSVCPDIVKSFYTKNIFRQDIRYKKGVHKEFIGSNAESIPVLNDSIDKMSLHCSLEHFENDSDINLFEEMHRILKRNGKAVITPLYLSKQARIITSPSVWTTKYNGVTEFPKFTKGYKLVLNEEHKQRYYKRFSVKTLEREILTPFKDKFMFEVYYMEDPKKNILYHPAFTLVCTKK